jgi:hypothetical protein
MHLYHIKQNGFTIGQARGKNNAFKALAVILKKDGIAEHECCFNGMSCDVLQGDNINRYKIEEA